MFAISKDGKIISKPHTTQDGAAMEAREKGLFMPIAARVVPEMLAPGVQIINLDPKFK